MGLMSLVLRELVWNNPSVDIENNQLFIGTGENMSSRLEPVMR